MKDETKEILENIWFRLHYDSPMSKKYGIELGKNECKILLDYIINSQKENERLNNIIKEVREYIEKYLKEHIIEDQPDEQSIFYDEKGYYIPNAKEQLLDILEKEVNK